MTEERDLAETDGNLARVLELAQKPKAEDSSDVIHRTIDQCLMNMVFQPIVELRSGKIFAYEALCRSRVPQFESPPVLIEAATKAGRIGELGRLQRKLASKNCPDWPIFLNISPNEFDEGWLVRPDDPIFRHRKPVYIEITESVPLVFFEQCHSVLEELRQKGARLAIDDLGAGYSNLKYIADLKPDIVKLDRELVAGCTNEGNQFELLCSIAKLCREVDSRVVAEGVENAEELEAVSAAGIEYCQGFFLGRPKISPSELSWPASELVTSEGFKVRRATHVTEQCDATDEDAERRVEELEEIRNLLEKSVRKARGEVVRLRKALGSAEEDGKQAEARLAEAQESLGRSEAERQRLGQLLEASSQPAEEPVPVAAPAAVQPERPPRSGRRMASHALLWAAGLLAVFALYKLDPLPDRTSATVATQSFENEAPAEEPEPAIPEPLPAAAEAAAASAPEVEEVATPRAEIESRVLGWASAWSAQDVESYLSFYSSGFTSKDLLTGDDWAAQRRARLSSPSFIDVKIEEMSVHSDPEGSVEAIFQQTYSSDRFTDTLTKRLIFAREDGEWRIVHEAAVEPSS
jgi:EAL domain-containing protein (putative c-di-GMP-specific phosphodiesterase class I)